MSPPPKYRNKFEEEAGEVLGDLCTYEPRKIPYVTHKTYLPDFVGNCKKGGRVHEIMVEAKGYFRVGDIQKYKAIRDSLSLTQELVFLLYSPPKKIRKGAKMNMGEWCTKEGFRWFTMEDIRDAFTT